MIEKIKRIWKTIKLKIFLNNSEYKDWEVYPSPDDNRDFLYSERIMKPIVASSFRPRKIINKPFTIKSQGKFGTCVGMAGSTAKDFREGLETSPLYVYRKCKEIDGMPHIEGTHLRILMKALKDIGICREDLYPYWSYRETHVWPSLSGVAEADAAKRRIEGYARIANKEELLDAIWRYGSVVIATFMPESMSMPSKGFLMWPIGQAKYAHAWVISGYDLDLIHRYPNGQTIKGFVRLINSWGDKWSDNGEVWFPIDALFSIEKEHNVPFAFDIFVPIDDMPSELKWGTLLTIPILKNRKLVVPIEPILEAFKIKFTVDANRRYTIYLNDDKMIQVSPGNEFYYIRDGREKTEVKESSLTFIEGRLSVPNHFVREALGLTDKLDLPKGQVTIMSGKTKVDMWLNRREYLTRLNVNK